MDNSPASSGSTFKHQNSPDSSGQDIQEQRKRKRMISNRESARRSRMRKQSHLDEMMAHVGQLKNDNNQILTNINIVIQLFENVEAENCVLRAQMSELTHRLHSLDEIVMNCMNFGGDGDGIMSGDASNYSQIVDYCVDDFLDQWNLVNNQGIMASANAFMY
ncbi:DNA-binding transcription factor [Lithospermum erythrorhizon]|uniref:DNA-binding transcription factor n=1 Tax=Lithospermum erythrorhizon TaxID=34254 RepID=A0AAV3PBQ3_LITER